jgi:hypothetical protein
MKQKYFTFRFSALDGMVPSFRRVYISVVKDEESITLQLQVNKVIKVHTKVILTNLELVYNKIKPYLFKHQIEAIELHLKTL